MFLFLSCIYVPFTVFLAPITSISPQYLLAVPNSGCESGIRIIINITSRYEEDVHTTPEL